MRGHKRRLAQTMAPTRAKPAGASCDTCQM